MNEGLLFPVSSPAERVENTKGKISRWIGFWFLVPYSVKPVKKNKEMKKGY